MKKRSILYVSLLSCFGSVCAFPQKPIAPIYPTLWYKPDSVLFNPTYRDSIVASTNYTMLMVYQTLQPDNAQPLWKISRSNNDYYTISTHGLSVQNFQEPSRSKCKIVKPCIYTMQHSLPVDTGYHSVHTLSIGANEDNDSSHICLYEAAYFDTRLSHKQLLMFQTYLALKHGITLDKAHYISTRGDTLWNAKTDATYYHRLRGIGTDTVYNLVAINSVSLEDSVLSIMYADKLPTNTYVIVGDDDGGLDWHAYEGNTAMLQRTWQLRKTGILPYVRICLALDKIAEVEDAPLLALLDVDNEIVQCIPADSIDLEHRAYYTYQENETRACFSFIIPEDKPNRKQQVHNNVPESTQKSAYSALRITIAPNPTHGLFTLFIDLPVDEDLLLVIQDPTGKIVTRQTLHDVTHFQYMGNLVTKGTYLVAIRTIQGKVLSTKEVIVY